MTSAYDPPRGKQETVLAEIWANLLGVTRVGRNDSFFELGGDSILAMGMVSCVRDALHVDVAAVELFRQPRLAQFAEIVTATKGVPSAGRVARDVGESGPLSFAQQR